MRPEWLLEAAPYALAVVAIVAAIKLLPPVVRGFRRWAAQLNRLFDVNLGAPEMLDPDRPEGPPLRPAIPDMGVRMTRVETLLREFVVGAVEEAKSAALAAAKSADEARGYAAASAGRFEDLSEQVADLSKKVDRWQTRDRVQAETAVGVLAEMGHHIPTSSALAEARDDVEGP